MGYRTRGQYPQPDCEFVVAIVENHFFIILNTCSVSVLNDASTKTLEIYSTGDFLWFTAQTGEFHVRMQHISEFRISCLYRAHLEMFLSPSTHVRLCLARSQSWQRCRCATRNLDEILSVLRAVELCNTL